MLPTAVQILGKMGPKMRQTPTLSLRGDHPLLVLHAKCQMQ